MKIEENLKNKKVRLTCFFGNDRPIFYNGTILEINSDHLKILDKFGHIVFIDFNSIHELLVLTPSEVGWE